MADLQHEADCPGAREQTFRVTTEDGLEQVVRCKACGAELREPAPLDPDDDYDRRIATLNALEPQHEPECPDPVVQRQFEMTAEGNARGVARCRNCGAEAKGGILVSVGMAVETVETGPATADGGRA